MSVQLFYGDPSYQPLQFHTIQYQFSQISNVFVSVIKVVRLSYKEETWEHVCCN